MASAGIRNIMKRQTPLMMTRIWVLIHLICASSKVDALAFLSVQLSVHEIPLVSFVI